MKDGKVFTAVVVAVLLAGLFAGPAVMRAAGMLPELAASCITTAPSMEQDYSYAAGASPIVAAVDHRVRDGQHVLCVYYTVTVQSPGSTTPPPPPPPPPPTSCTTPQPGPIAGRPWTCVNGGWQFPQ